MKRKKIQRRLIGLFYHLGIYIDIEFFPSVEKVHHRISHQHPQKQIATLEKICSAVSAANDHKYYNRFLKKFIPDWNMKIQNPKFVGSGIWTGFNSFRIIENQEKKQFEKLFETQSGIPQKLIWLQENLFPKLAGKIRTPKILHHFQGEVLSLLYFEFVEANSIAEGKGEKPAIEISKKLYALSKKMNFREIEIPEKFMDFRKHNRYNLWISKAQKELAKNNIDFSELEKIIDSAKKVPTHGDLKDLNLFEDGSLIDWDEFGFFPMGMEQAFSYTRNILHYDSVEKSPLAWLEFHFKTMVPRKEWNIFKLSFAYFLFVFSFEKLMQEKYSSLKKEILEVLGSVYS